MEEDQRKEIEEIISHLKCPKDFTCKKTGFKVVVFGRRSTEVQVLPSH
jgi:hypothetical protein